MTESSRVPRTALAVVLLAAACAPGCGAFRAKTPTAPIAATVPIGSAHATAMSSTVVLAKVGGRRVAYISDEDTASVLAVDLETRTEIGSASVTALPGPMIMLPSGKLVVGTQASFGAVVYEPKPDGQLVAVGAVLETESEPRGFALSPDKSTLYVTSGWGHTLSAFKTSDFSRTFEIDVAREPRAVMASDDGKHVFVSHAVGSQVSVLDVAQPKSARAVALRAPAENERQIAEAMRKEGPEPEENKADFKKRVASLERRGKEGFPSCQGFTLAAYKNHAYAPEVLVDPGEVEQKTEGGYGGGQGDSEMESIAVLDAATGTPQVASLVREHNNGPGLAEESDVETSACLLPRASIVDDPSGALIVACRGIDQVIAYDATASIPTDVVLGRWSVGQGPSGMAIDPERHELVVWSQFDRTLTVLPLSDLSNPELRTVMEKQKAALASGDWEAERNLKRPKLKAKAVRLAMTPYKQRDEAQVLGRSLFHRTDDPRISSDGRACASCHPDGRDDGITWATPEGPRRSILLAGRLEYSAPYAWEGNAPTVQKHLASTFKRLGGTGLEGTELEALVSYVKNLPGPLRRPTFDVKQVELGQKVFASARTGCASCHSGAVMTDGKMHDVKSGRAFNTPSLLDIGTTGPFFHDGRYASLTELLRESDGKMGHTKHLTGNELEALEAYLKTL